MSRMDARRWALIADVAAGQSGLITAAQLAEIGLSDDAVRRRTRAGGSWRRVLPGVYAVAPGELDEEQRRTAALLYVRADCALTGVTALRLHGVRTVSRLTDEPVHVLVPHARRRSSHGFVVVERTTRWTPPAHVAGVPLMPAARAAIDASRRLISRRTIEALLAELVQTGRCSLGELRTELRRAQRRGTAVAWETLDRLAEGPASAPEIQLHRLWEESNLPAALWNADLETPSGEFMARPDAFVAESGVVVEVDSREFHYEAERWDRTMRRHALLSSYGLIVLHVSPRRIDDDGDGVVRDIRRAIDAQGRRSDFGVRVRRA